MMKAFHQTKRVSIERRDGGVAVRLQPVCAVPTVMARLTARTAKIDVHTAPGGCPGEVNP